jgi:hypothetical protein
MFSCGGNEKDILGGFFFQNKCNFVSEVQKCNGIRGNYTVLQVLYQNEKAVAVANF